MRKFGVLGALAFALLVASPVSASGVALYKTGGTSGARAQFWIKTGGTYHVHQQWTGNGSRCSINLRLDARAIERDTATAATVNVTDDYSVRLRRGWHVLMVRTNCAWSFRLTAQ